MNTRKRVLSIQDISCLGQCSLGVALPALSAAGVECAVLPTAILSTHTGPEFQPPYIRDLTEDMPRIAQSWADQGIRFDAISIGYLGSEAQIGHVSHLLEALAGEETLVLLDPVMADNGRFYSRFDESYARAMRVLCGRADILLPNLTEACFLLGEEVPEVWDDAFARSLAGHLAALGPETVLLKGARESGEEISNLLWEKGEGKFLTFARLHGRYHGTGDLFAAALLGGLMQGKSLEQSVRRAGEAVQVAIRATEPEHSYGVRFEAALGLLTE